MIRDIPMFSLMALPPELPNISHVATPLILPPFLGSALDVSAGERIAFYAFDFNDRERNEFSELNFFPSYSSIGFIASHWKFGECTDTVSRSAFLLSAFLRLHDRIVGRVCWTSMYLEKKCVIPRQLMMNVSTSRVLCETR